MPFHFDLAEDEKLFARFYNRSNSVWVRRGKRINNSYRHFFEKEVEPLGQHDYRVVLPATHMGGVQTVVFAKSHIPRVSSSKTLLSMKWAPPEPDLWDEYKATAINGWDWDPDWPKYSKDITELNEQKKNQPKTLAEMLEEEA